MRIGLDYGRRAETLPEHARKLIIARDPRPRIASFPAGIQNAIAQGNLAIGMSKEQALMSVGYPARNETPSLDAAQWKYYDSWRAPYTIVWDARGRLKEVVADATTLEAVLLSARR